MKFIRFLILLFLSIILFSCNSDSPTTNNNTPVDSSAFKYPFTNGSSWNYTYNSTVNNIRPDSIRHYFSQYPINATGTINILYDTIVNGINTKCFFDHLVQDTNYMMNRTYFTNDDSSLTAIAYRSEAHWFFATSFQPDRKLVPLEFRIKGTKFISVTGFFQSQYAKDINTDLGLSDSLYINAPPIICMKYPVKTGTSWFRFFGLTSDTLIKKYTGFINVNVGNNIVSCVKMQFQWSGLDNFSMYNYYSKFGQMKRQNDFTNVEVGTEFGTTIGFIDIHENYQVTNFNIVNP